VAPRRPPRERDHQERPATRGARAPPPPLRLPRPRTDALRYRPNALFSPDSGALPAGSTTRLSAPPSSSWAGPTRFPDPNDPDPRSRGAPPVPSPPVPSPPPAALRETRDDRPAAPARDLPARRDELEHPARHPLRQRRARAARHSGDLATRRVAIHDPRRLVAPPADMADLVEDEPSPVAQVEATPRPRVEHHPTDPGGRAARELPPLPIAQIGIPDDRDRRAPTRITRREHHPGGRRDVRRRVPRRRAGDARQGRDRENDPGRSDPPPAAALAAVRPDRQTPRYDVQNAPPDQPRARR
jgi:hypothetical protein